ncbi:MAG: tetraacyldisaccharide 4'-kinase [Candidatus Sumerlaeota bacterium]|nr:tetraacyldisaccharide 4'-kinase [Candidatus Sumerlaeota bacterium]
MKDRIRAIVEGREPRGAAERAAAAALAGLSGLYRPFMAARARAYRAGLLRSRSLSRPVVCVGNLTMGGTGKTPIAADMAQILQTFGHRPAVVSRGYRANRPRDEIVVVSEGRGPIVPPGLAGDEPYLLASLLSGIPVVIGADRWRAGRTAIERLGATIVVLDDGFQHLRLRRDFDLVALDASQDPASMRLLPRGPMREDYRALGRASAIALTRVERSRHADAWRTIAERWGGGAPVFPVRFVPVALVADCGRGPLLALDELRERRTLVLSAIARPERFRRMVESLGAAVRAEKAFPDHHRYTAEDMKEIRSLAARRGASWIVTTDKDAVKLHGFAGAPPPIYSLRIAPDFGATRDEFIALLRSRFSPRSEP